MERPIVIIEDGDEDVEAVRWAMQKLGLERPLTRFVDGDSALEWLDGPTQPWPGLILLDLNLPGTDGREVLALLKGHARLGVLPVVVLSTSANPRDVQACYAQGASGYLIKPVNFERFVVQLRQLFDFWLQAVVLPEAREARP